MPLLLTDYRAPDPTGAINAYLAGEKLHQAAIESGIQQQQFAQQMLARAEQEKRLQAQSQANMALQLLQEQRYQDAQRLNDEFRTKRLTEQTAAREARERAAAAANAPYRDPYATAAGTPSIPATTEGVDLWTAGAPGSAPILGRITDYGQADDETPDSYTRAGKSAIGNLRPDSMALSPDLEAQMKAMGAKIGTPVTLTLENGEQVTRFWDDRTAKSYKGKALTGRVDLYSPDGKSPLRDMKVVDIKPADIALGNMGEIPSTKALPPDPASQVIAPPPAADPATMALSARLNGFPKKVAYDTLSRFELERAKQEAKGNVSSDLIAGMEPVPEHNTYRRKDGIEYFVTHNSDGSQKLVPYRPHSVKASRWAIGSDGHPYALGSDGEPMQPIPEGVTLNFNPGKLQTLRDKTGNVYAVGNDQQLSMLIPAKSALKGKDREAYMEDVKTLEEAKATLEAQESALEEKGQRGLRNWFGVSQASVDEAKKQFNAAQTRMELWHKQYPDLKQEMADAPASTPKPVTVSAPAPAKAPVDRKALAREALADPNATPAEKAQARKILGV